MSQAKTLLLALITLLLLTPSAVAKSEKQVQLEVGDKAPTFVGIDDQNEKWDSKEKAGKKIYVVYFYPADMTPGCTKQACNYRDAVAEYQRDDVEVIGVSGDGVENHRLFKQEHDLNFTLLADPKGEIAEAFGVETGKGGSYQTTVGGKEVTLNRNVTANRWTFVIDKDWRIAHKDTKVDAAKDTATVAKVVEKLVEN